MVLSMVGDASSQPRVNTKSGQWNTGVAAGAGEMAGWRLPAPPAASGAAFVPPRAVGRRCTRSLLLRAYFVTADDGGDAMVGRPKVGDDDCPSPPSGWLYVVGEAAASRRHTTSGMPALASGITLSAAQSVYTH